LIILDTNVLSELMRDDPDPTVRAWVDGVRTSDQWTTAITALELMEGVRRLPDGQRKSRLAYSLDVILHDEFAGRILPFDLPAAEATATLSVDRLRRGMNVEMRDTQIAGIAVARSATLVTRNVKHFSDLPIEVIDPWTRRPTP
jgi:predicted nucleic acid-binding protein